jgi:serine/threonine protein kinase
VDNIVVKRRREAGPSPLEIFMGLKEGTLESLIESGNGLAYPDSFFHQMLQALDCLALNSIIHRDVKPENILYVTRVDGQHQFQLGDFGLCNHAVSAKTSLGTPLFMAPEVVEEKKQTHKIDVWSLFVTMLWTLDVGGFRQKCSQFKKYRECFAAVLLAASAEGRVSVIREMAIMDPKERASAAQMLVKCFNGEGLSTPRNQVPALQATPAIAAAGAPVPAPPVSTTGTAQTPKIRQKNVLRASTESAKLFKPHQRDDHLSQRPRSIWNKHSFL